MTKGPQVRAWLSGCLELPDLPLRKKSRPRSEEGGGEVEYDRGVGRGGIAGPGETPTWTRGNKDKTQGMSSLLPHSNPVPRSTVIVDPMQV